jgi:hypothetical protein
VPKLRPRSRGSSIVVIQNATKAFSAFDRVVEIWFVARFLYEAVIESLMITLTVIMIHVFGDGYPKMTVLPEYPYPLISFTNFQSDMDLGSILISP